MFKSIVFALLAVVVGYFLLHTVLGLFFTILPLVVIAVAGILLGRFVL